MSLRATLSACLLGFVLTAGIARAGTCEGVAGIPGDLDGDGYVVALDCDDSNTGVWSSPGEATNLRVTEEPDHTFVWDAPADLGGGSATVTHDLMRSEDPTNFATHASLVCVEPADEDTSAIDPETPSPGDVLYYLAISRNSCGGGDPGQLSDGATRLAAACDCAVFCDDGDACTTDGCSAGSCESTPVVPVLLREPASIAVCDGKSASFTVVAEGTGPLTYAWMQDGGPVGSNMPTLNVVGTTSIDGAAIRVEVTDGCSTAVSDSATLTVFADAVSCDGGLDGQEPPNGAHDPDRRGWIGPASANGKPMWTNPPQNAGTAKGIIQWTNPPKNAGAAKGKVKWTNPPKNAGRVSGSEGGGRIHLHSGEMALREVDLAIAGRGLDFIWARSYRSREWRQTLMGVGWTHSHDRRVEIDPDDANRRLVHRGDSRIDRFLPDGLGCWESPGFFEQLCELPGGSLTLTFADGTVWTFGPLDGTSTAGKIVTAADRNGNTAAYGYDGSGRLERVTDSLGRDVTIAYDARNRVSDVTDFSGRTVHYEYYGTGEALGTLDDLRAVTTPTVTGTPTGNDFLDGKTTTYTYTTGFANGRLNHNLLTITDAEGRTYLATTYTSEPNPNESRFDRIDRITLLTQDDETSLGLAYVPETPDPSNGFAVSRTIVNDRAGNVREYLFDGQARLVLERELTGRAPQPHLPTGAASNRPTDPLRPSDPPAFETSWEYSSDFLPQRCVLPEGNELLWSYDEGNPDPRLAGNLLTRTRLPGPLGGSPAQIVETWTYAPGFGTRYDSLRPDASGSSSPTVTADPGVVRLDASLIVFPTSFTDGRGETWTGTYDAAGNLQSWTEPTATIGTPGGLPQPIQHGFVHNGFGQLTQYTSPAGRIDEYAYHTSGPQAGYLASVTVDAPGLALTTAFENDALGRIVAVTDPRGHRTDRVVNERDQVVRIVAPAPFAHETDFYYDAKDRLVRVDRQNVDDQGATAANSHVSTLYKYDALDRQVRATGEIADGECAVVEFVYDANDRLAERRDGEATNGNQPDNRTTWVYDERDLLFETTRAPGSADQSTDRYAYDLNGNPASLDEGLEGAAGAHVTDFEHDGYDRLVGVTDAEGNVRAYQYDAGDNRVSVRVDGEEIENVSGTNIRLSEAAFVYDEPGRLVREEVQHFETGTGNPIGDGLAVTGYTWTADSLLAGREDDNLHRVALDYDSARRLAQIEDPRGNRVAYTYDAASNPTVVTETDLSDGGQAPETVETTHEFDELDRRERITDNAGNLREYGYDSRGNRTSATDPLGNRTRYAFDGLDRLVRVERDLTDTGDGMGTVTGQVVTTREWDDSGRTVSRTDDNGNTTSYAYDGLDRLTGVVHADGTQQTYVYDAHDNVVTTIDANGSQAAQLYDALDRLLQRTVIPGAGVSGQTTLESFAYDGLSRRVEAEDDDTEVVRVYDSMSNVVREDLRIGSGPVRSLARAHDGVGNPISLNYPSGLTVGVAYDPVDRPQTVFVSGALAASYAYLGPYRVQSLGRGNGVTTDYEYDGLRRATRVHHHLGGTTVADRLLSWDASSNKTKRVDFAAGGLTHDYAHDSLYRLVRSVHTGGTATQIDYTLDGAGNRLQVTGGPDAGAYTLDGTLPQPADAQVHQYTSTPEGLRLHDDNGNTTTLDGGSASQRELLYDFRDRIVEIDAGSVVTVYRYDALGRRVETIPSSGDVRRYYYDGWRVVEEQDGSDQAVATFVWGRYLDELLQMREAADLNGNGALDLYYAHGNDMHSVLALTDSSGAPAERYAYGDFGRPSYFDGSGMPLASSAVGNPYLFTGRRYDATGLYHFRTRHLDPAAGRFLTRDSIGSWGDASNLGNGRTYVGNNPWSYVDPYGALKLLTAARECATKAKNISSGGSKSQRDVCDGDLEIAEKVEGTAPAGEPLDGGGYVPSLRGGITDRPFQERDLSPSGARSLNCGWWGHCNGWAASMEAVTGPPSWFGATDLPAADSQAPGSLEVEHFGLHSNAYPFEKN